MSRHWKKAYLLIFVTVYSTPLYSMTSGISKEPTRYSGHLITAAVFPEIE